MGNTRDDSFVVFVDECNEILERLVLGVLELEKGNVDPELIHSLYRDMHTLKGSSALFGFSFLSRLAHSLESRFEVLRNKKVVVDPVEIDAIFESLDVIGQILTSIQVGSNEDFSREVIALEKKLSAA